MANLHYRPSRVARLSAFILAALMVFSFGGGSACAQGDGSSETGAAALKSKTMDQVKSILVFPTTNKAASDIDSDNADRLAVLVKLKLNATGRYHAIGYARTLSAVDRAYSVDDPPTLTKSDLTPPFISPTKARKITEVVGADAFLLITVDSGNVNVLDKTATVTATAKLYGTTSDENAEPLRDQQVVGKALATTPSEPIGDIGSRAIESAADKIASIIAPAFVVTHNETKIVRSTGNKKAAGVKLLTVVLVGVMAGVIIAQAHTGSSSGSSGGSGATTTTSTGGGTTFAPPTLPTSFFRR